MKITKTDFGVTKEGTPVDLYTLTNNQGIEAKITTYGGTVTSLKVPDKEGKLEDVVLGFDSLEGYTEDLYLEENPYFGAIIGRYGNRIHRGRFSLNGKEYKLATNNGPNHLHGGNRGFDKKVWKAEEFQSAQGVGLQLKYVSQDGEEGYPGTLTVAVTYTLTSADELKIDYTATTDKDTPVNLTNHSYFNLTGNARRNILDHQVMVNADRFVPVDEGFIPTGELQQVEGTPFDLREPTSIGKRIDQDHQQLVNGKGYDHTFVLKGAEGEMALSATVYEQSSGRYLEVFTTEPGVQLYTGNFLNGNLVGKGGVAYQHRWGLCLETQHFPDSPNQPQFPSVLLKQEETYKTSTVYRFSVKQL